MILFLPAGTCFPLAFFLGIPLRGGITEGIISIIKEQQKSNADNSQFTFVGKSIVDAYLMEQKQEWSGCIISESCIKLYEQMLDSEANLSDDPQRLKRAVSLPSLIDRGFLLKYNVPFKDEKFSEEYVINWVRQFNPKLNEKTIKDSFAAHKKSTNHPDVLRKIENTISFWSVTPEGKGEEISLSRKS